MSCFASCCTALTCGLCSSVASGISKRSARLAYCGLFGISLITCFILREVGAPLLERIPWINHSHSHHSKAWLDTEAVLRMSFGNFLFFGALALIMIGVRDQNDRRDPWHHGGWAVKIAAWALLSLLSFFLPNAVMSVYASVSRFGAGLFLFIQVIILLDFTHAWNDAWIARDERKWYAALLAVSVGCYITSIAFCGVLFLWFNPSGHDCGLNVFFIVITIILALVFTAIALLPQVNGSLLPASVISLYCAYVCYTGLSSEPEDYGCNGLHENRKAVSTGTLILGMLTTILSVLYSALRAGSSSAFLSPKSDDDEAATTLLESPEDVGGPTPPRAVSYSYAFFHSIFALSTMYSAMLLSGWDTKTTTSIDVGWPSVWVRICTEWVTAALYLWTMLAPILFPHRDF